MRDRHSVHRAIEALEQRRLLSSVTLSAISFNGTDGYNPVAAVGDSSGDIFGVTSFTETGSTIGSGVVYEIVAGTTKIVDLADFPSLAGGGLNQGMSIVLDTSGNLYGTDTNSLFEIAKGTHTLKTLVSFASDQDEGNVYAIDSSGDLFGLSGGSVFELPAGSTTITYNLFGDEQGLENLELGPDGNLYGTTHDALYEDNLTNNTATLLASFNSATTGNTPTGLTFDADGNIWGFCSYGGPNGSAPGDGTVWEYDKTTQTLSEQAAFATASGYTPITNPVINPSTGVIYGASSQGGANGDGTLFSFDTSEVNSAASPAEIRPEINAAVTDLASFSDFATAASGSSMVGSYSPYTTTPDGPYVETPPVSDSDTGAFGTILYPNQAPKPPDQQDWADRNKSAKDYDSQQKQLADLAKSEVTDQGPPPITIQSVTADTASASRLTELTRIEKLLADAKTDLDAASTYITKGEDFLAHYTAFGSDITSLQAELAATTNATTQAKLQQEIDVDQTDQDADATDDSIYYTDSGDKLTDASDLLTDSQADLDDLPKAEVSFTGSVVTVPSPMTRGKSATVVLDITNNGNVTADGGLDIELFAQPLGTTGGADVELPTVGINIKILPGATASESLTFTVPRHLASGHYTLIADLDPKNLFKEAHRTAPIVGTEIFRVN